MMELEDKSDNSLMEEVDDKILFEGYTLLSIRIITSILRG